MARFAAVRLVAVALLGCLLTLSSGSAAAQDAVELWGAKGGWAGEDAENDNGGWATGASYTADVGWPIDVGADLLFGRYDEPVLLDHVDEFQFAVTVRRWLLGDRTRLRPWIGGRFGYTRLSAEFDTEELSLDFEQNGILGGLTLGAVYPTGKTLSPFLSVEANRQRYTDTSLFLDDIQVPQTGGSAWRFFFRVGVSFGSGWERRGS